MNLSNVFENLPQDLKEEFFEDLLRMPRLRIERIVSRGHGTPKGFWYDQKQHEWVMVLKGRAGLNMEGCGNVLVLNPGDWVNIPARCRHRVEWTEPDEETIWLAIHYSE